MPVRLLRVVNGQAVNTTYWGTDEADQIALGAADTRLDLASDYQELARTVTTATANAGRHATVYLMNSGSAQTLTINPSGYWPLGTVLTVAQLGAGAVTIAAGAGVTINTALTSLITKGPQNLAQLLKVGANSWVAFGGLGG